MTSRRRVREVSAWISDVPGVRTVEARLDAATVHVTGTAEPAAIAAAIRQAGYTATSLADGTSPAGVADHDGTPETDRRPSPPDDPATSPDEVAP